MTSKVNGLPATLMAASLGTAFIFGAAAMPARANADDPCGGYVCITDIHPAGRYLHVEWTGNDRFAYYEVYAERTGSVDVRTEKLGPEQFAYDVSNIVPGATYKVQVLGCTATTPWYNDGPCGSVDQRIVTV